MACVCLCPSYIHVWNCIGMSAIVIFPNHTQWSIQFDRKVRMTVAKVICFHAGILVLLFNIFLMCYVIIKIIIIM